MGYLANFIVYTLAMIGIIMLAIFVFKATGSCANNKKSKCLKVLDTMSIAPRKTLYIIAAGNEKFLIAGDVDKTTLISKLNSSNEVALEQISSVATTDNTHFSTQSYKTQSTMMDSGYNSVMKNLALKMNQGFNKGE